MKQGTQNWCSVTTLRDSVRRKVGGGFRRDGTHVGLWPIQLMYGRGHHNIIK